VNKISALAMRDNEIFWELKLTVGLDLGGRAGLTASWLRQLSGAGILRTRNEVSRNAFPAKGQSLRAGV
jgi:hypothetical protein